MGVAERRSEFSVFVVDRDATAAKTLKESIASMGYSDARFFPTVDSALAMASEAPPHIVLVDTASLESELDEFLAKLSALSDEILPILIVPAPRSLAALQFVNRALAYDFIVKPFISGLELVQKIDRAAGRLFYQFESEQLREHFERGGPALQPAPRVSQNDDTRATGDFAEIKKAIDRFALNRELDPTLQIFLDSLSRLLGDTPIAYFKYVPAHMSVLFAQAALLPVERFRGIGIDLRKEDAAHLSGYFDDPRTLPQLRQLMAEVFKRDHFTAFAHRNDHEVLGLFVVLDEIRDSAKTSEMECLLTVFEIAYKRNLTMKEKHLLDTNDPATGLLNRRHFLRILDEEIARSRRLLMPLSLVMIDIDGTHALNEKIGFQQTDAVLRAFAQLLRKTARANDVIARIGPDEFACLLPHTPAAGGAIKAERLRRIAQAARIQALESHGAGPLSISCGVTEYPSFCGDAESLLRSADDALHEVKSSGGGRVCLASVPSGFQTDFIPREVPHAPKNKSGEAK